MTDKPHSLIHHLDLESMCNQSQPGHSAKMKQQLWMEVGAIHQFEGNVTLVMFADWLRN